MNNLIILIAIFIFISLFVNFLRKFYFKYSFFNTINSIFSARKNISFLILLSTSTYIYNGFYNHIFILLQEQSARANMGHITIYKQGYKDTDIYKKINSNIENSKKIISILESDLELKNNIDIYSPQREFAGLIMNMSNHRTAHFSGLGIEPSASIKIGAFDITKIGSELSNLANDEITIDSRLAELTDIHYGDRVKLIVTNYNQEKIEFFVSVRGIFHSELKNTDYGLVKIPLETINTIFNDHNISMINILLKNESRIKDVISKIESANKEYRLNLVALSGLARQENIKNKYDYFYFSLSFLNIFIVIVSFFIFNKVIENSIRNSIKDICFLHYLGMWKSSFSFIFIMEGFLIALFISILTLLLGSMFAWLINLKEIAILLPDGGSYPFFIFWSWQHHFIFKIPLLLIMSSLIASFLSFSKVSSLLKERIDKHE